MTVNIIVRKDAVTIISESLAREVLASTGTVNIDVKPGGTAIVIEDGASPEEIAALSKA